MVIFCKRFSLHGGVEIGGKLRSPSLPLKIKDRKTFPKVEMLWTGTPFLLIWNAASLLVAVNSMPFRYESIAKPGITFPLHSYKRLLPLGSPFKYWNKRFPYPPWNPYPFINLKPFRVEPPHIGAHFRKYPVYMLTHFGFQIIPTAVPVFLTISINCNTPVYRPSWLTHVDKAPIHWLL